MLRYIMMPGIYIRSTKLSVSSNIRQGKSVDRFGPVRLLILKGVEVGETLEACSRPLFSGFVLLNSCSGWKFLTRKHVKDSATRHVTLFPLHFNRTEFYFLAYILSGGRISHLKTFHNLKT